MQKRAQIYDYIGEHTKTLTLVLITLVSNERVKEFICQNLNAVAYTT